MRRVGDGISTWPRWIKWGALSAFAALALYSIAFIIPALRFIVFAGLLPTGNYVPFLVPTNVYPDFVILDMGWYIVGAGEILFGFVSSFLFGALLGRIVNRFRVAALIWLLTFFVGWFINYLFWLIMDVIMGAVIS
jgi:hypothetical protein